MYGSESLRLSAYQVQKKANSFCGPRFETREDLARKPFHAQDCLGLRIQWDARDEEAGLNATGYFEDCDMSSTVSNIGL